MYIIDLKDTMEEIKERVEKRKGENGKLEIEKWRPFYDQKWSVRTCPQSDQSGQNV